MSQKAWAEQRRPWAGCVRQLLRRGGARPWCLQVCCATGGVLSETHRSVASVPPAVDKEACARGSDLPGLPGDQWLATGAEPCKPHSLGYPVTSITVLRNLS